MIHKMPTYFTTCEHILTSIQIGDNFVNHWVQILKAETEVAETYQHRPSFEIVAKTMPAVKMACHSDLRFERLNIVNGFCK
jgi:hypothetical protein